MQVLSEKVQRRMVQEMRIAADIFLPLSESKIFPTLGSCMHTSRKVYRVLRRNANPECVPFEHAIGQEQIGPLILWGISEHCR